MALQDEWAFWNKSQAYGKISAMLGWQTMHWGIQNNENLHADPGQQTGTKKRRHITYKRIIPA